MPALGLYDIAAGCRIVARVSSAAGAVPCSRLANVDEDRSLPPWVIVVGIVAALALIFLVGVGYGQQWGAEQWGPLAAWIAGAATFGAVVVALRQARVAQRQAAIAQQQADETHRESLRLQFDRLVDHEISRRRECIDAFSDLWAAIVSVDFLTFTQDLDDLDATFNPLEQRTPSGLNDSKTYGEELAERIRDFFGQWIRAVQPPLFRARLVLRGTPLQDAVVASTKVVYESGLVVRSGVS